ncbi:hypothetical protein JTE90_003328 [Oedothorax gibbosus]|uniref:B-block binding subunit of TFIIIC domain-containing protein n=1 Tax=Oedothorax gibbosus TaxID=931172 RepID=A0AAV6UFR2_9ARAC|nr:hypothetical protein JTE90_003328 [Oedothorax gibbosus]
MYWLYELTQPVLAAPDLGIHNLYLSIGFLLSCPKMGTAFDFLSSLLDEIALEGLDGITLEMLWQRLADRPDFPIALDEDSKSFFWDNIAKHKDIEIYQLPEPRPFVPIYNRYDYIDPELGVVLEPAEKLPDTYAPIIQVKDGEERGSCPTYKTRKCITSDVRCGNEVLLVSLNQAVEKWGNSLVLVASPKQRLLSLIGTEANPLMDLSLESYCLLERIGRSRYLGEVTQGEGGLLSLKAPFCKQLHYYRKKLSDKGLITKQMHYMKMNRGQTSNGCLFHLTRFYVQRKTKMATLMKKLCDLLKVKPGLRETCKAIREELGIKDNTFKKLFYRPFQKWVKLQTVSCKDFFTDGSEKDWYTVSGHEKVVKIVILLRHCDEEDEDEEENSSYERTAPSNIHFDSSRLLFNVPLVYQVFQHINKAGPEGISAGDLGRIMTLPRLDIRGLLRILLKKGEVVSMLQDRGRQKVTKYISKSYEMQNEAYSTLKDQNTISTIQVNGDSLTHSVKREAVGEEDENIAPKKKKVRFADDTDESKSILVEKAAESNFQNIVSQVLEVQSNDLSNGNAPKLVSFSDGPTAVISNTTRTQMTYRKLKRANMILSFLKKEKVSTIGDLQKHILEKEQEEGYNYRLDKKSTTRLVKALHADKKLKKFIAELELEKERTKIELICDNSLEQSDPFIQVAIEQAKFKYFSVSKENKKSQNSDKLNSSLTNKDESLAEQSSVKEEVKEKEQKASEILHKYPLMTPKYMRAKSLHMFLHYLVYQHKAELITSNEQVVYQDTLSWKRFVPPLPPDYSRNPGWCFLSDIYSRMPLSLFLKIVNFRQGVPGLNTYLENEEKANYLIKFLPLHLRNNLLNNRKYLFSTNDVIRVLCYMGLVSMGPQAGKQKDQMFLYVHKHASIKDTTMSSPGYLHVQSDLDYEVKPYTFHTEDDVQNYWLDLESTSFNTPLGKFSAAAGKTIAIMEANFKPELMATYKVKGFDEVLDNGEIPGDGLGAGGYDSVLFMHSRRNWHPPATAAKPLAAKDKSVPVLNSLQHLLQTSGSTKPESRSRLQRLTKSSLLLQKENKLQKSTSKRVVVEHPQTVSKGKKKKIKIRTVKARSSKRLPYYDEKDRAAMERLDKARCDWSPQEDSFLLLCKVASCVLDPLNNKNLAVPFTIVRDLLHEHVPEVSINKSSRACQRRVRYMMMNSTTVNNVQVFLGEALQDAALVSEYSKPKPPKSNEAVWKSMFTGVLHRLREKFTLPASDRCEDIKLPDTVEGFNTNFEIVKEESIFDQSKIYQDPKSEDDARKFILISLILSAMAAANDGNNWSYLLHKLYQAYPESLLQSAVAHLRKQKVIAVKKKNHKMDLQRSIKSACPYKFSITYNNAMLTKFPIRIFKECKELLDNLLNLKSETNVELKGNIPPGFCASVLALVTMERLVVHTQVPDQIILFDSSLSKEARTNIVERMINALSDKESLELTMLLNAENRALPSNNDNDESNQTHSAVVHDSEMEDFDPLSNEDLSNSQVSEVQRFASASRFALYLLRQEMSQPPVERVQHSQEYIVLNSCRVFCRLKPSTHPVIPVNPPEVIADTPDWNKTAESRYITRERMELTDNRIAEIKKILTCLIPTDSLSAKYNHENLDCVFEPLYEEYSPQTILDAICIYKYISGFKWKGVPEKDIWKSFLDLPGELSVFHHLQRLRDSFLVIRSGITTFTYICMSFANNWVLSSFLLKEVQGKNSTKTESDKPTLPNTSPSTSEVNPNQDFCSSCHNDRKLSTSSKPDTVSQHTRTKSMTKIYFVPRTWRNPDGTLNKPTFFQLLSTVLSRIIAEPGASTGQVCEYFTLVLAPVQTLELIEVLEKACCVYKYYCTPLRKCSLFSRPQQIFIKENPEPDDIEHLEPFPDAVCKVAQLMDAM